MIGGFIGNPIGGVINVNNFFLAVTTGAYTITGQAASFLGKLTAVAGSYAISGSAATFLAKMPTIAGSYAITGQAVSFNTKLITVAGSYAITGQAALFATRMPVTAGAYALTGQAATFNPKELVSAGAYAITGNAITFKLNWVVASGSYALTGSPASFYEVINGAGGGTKKLYRGKLEIARRKIRVTDDDGRARQVDLLRRFKAPPPFALAPDWVLDRNASEVPPPTNGFSSGDDERDFAPAPTTMPAAKLPQSLLALQDARDENELLEFLTNTPDPLVEDIRQVLGILAASGQLEQLLETA